MNQKNIEIEEKEILPTTKKKTLKVKIVAWTLTSFIGLAIGTPFIGLGIFIGWLIWK